jgi:ABC-type lipoprotein export system ATPase subunit
VLVTHDPALAERADRVISLSGGVVATDRPGTAARGNGAATGTHA